MTNQMGQIWIAVSIVKWGSFQLPLTKLFLTGALLLASMAASSAESELESRVKMSEWYIGAGMGISQLEPDASGTNYRVTEENDLGWKVFAGRDISKHWTVELLYSDLGKAELTNQSIPNQKGEVAYSVLALTSQYYFNQKVDRGFRHGWQPYLRAGLAVLRAEKHNFINTEVRQDHDVQIYLGGGIEYSWDNRWAVRAAIDVYDVDAAYAGISLLKRFGGKKSEPRKLEEVAYTPEPVVVDPVRPAIVYTAGCTQFERVSFLHSSAKLTEKAKQKLERTAEILIQNPDFQVEVQAFTDSGGTEANNQVLSDARADSVTSYLIGKGINGTRLVSKGYGETKPITDNDSVGGRAENRRVEFRLINGSLCE
jgi:OOP family OmpA-OmpF porin